MHIISYLVRCRVTRRIYRLQNICLVRCRVTRRLYRLQTICNVLEYHKTSKMVRFGCCSVPVISFNFLKFSTVYLWASQPIYEPWVNVC